MAYFWVNQAQEYLQSLGFGSTPARHRQSSQFAVSIDQYGGDNSYQPGQARLDPAGQGRRRRRRGRRGDRHEYGHAVHASQVAGFGTSLDAGADR